MEKTDNGYSNWPSIDHSLLSPSGKMSKRARKAANERETVRLFPLGYWDFKKPQPPTPAETILSIQRRVQNLREIAGRGMNSAKYLKQALALEKEANALLQTHNL